MGRLFIEPIEMLYAWAAKNDDVLSKLRRRRKKHTASKDKARKFNNPQSRPAGEPLAAWPDYSRQTHYKRAPDWSRF